MVLLIPNESSNRCGWLGALVALMFWLVGSVSLAATESRPAAPSLRLTWQGPNPSRVFQSPDRPEVIAVITNTGDDARTLTLTVETACLNAAAAPLATRIHQLTVGPGEQKRIGLADFEHSLYGVYQARVSLEEKTKSAIVEAIRWTLLPSLPADERWDRLGVIIHALRAHHIVELKGLGMPWCRINWHWMAIAPNRDQIRWDLLEPQIQLARKHNITLLPILNIAAVPSWYAHPTKPAPYFDESKFEAYAYTLLDRYAQDITAVQIYNEPDWGVAEYFGRKNIQVSAEEDELWRAFLGRWIVQFSAKLRERYPGLCVVGPGFPDNPAGAIGWAKLLDPPYEIGRALDVFAWHNYPAPRSAAPDYGAGSVLEMDRFVKVIRDKIAGRQVWVTEQGYATVDNCKAPFNDRQRYSLLWPLGVSEKQQGDYLVRLFLLQWEAGLDKTFMFMLGWEDTAEAIAGGDPGHFYGWFAAACGGAKLAYAQLATMGHFLMNAQFVARVDLGDKTCHGLAFERNGKSILACWKVDGDATVVLPKIWQEGVVFDGFGNNLRDAVGARIEIGETPIYLVKE